MKFPRSAVWATILGSVSIASPAFADDSTTAPKTDKTAAPSAPSDASSKPLDSAPAEPPPPTDVTVQGDRADTLKRASGSGTKIGLTAIKDAQPQNTGEMLKRVTGVHVQDEDPGGFRLNLGIRGLSPNRSRLVLVEEDGVPVVVSPYGEPELYYITSVDRVREMDVVKGSDVLLYGPQTVGAVIQLHTFDPTEKPAWNTTVKLGTHGFAEALGRYSATQGDVGYVVQLSHQGGAGYRGMGFEATDGFGKVRIASNKGGELTLKVGFHDDATKTTYTGLTDYLYRQDPGRPTIAPDDYFKIRRYEAVLNHQQRVGENTVIDTSAFAYQMNFGLRLQDFDRSRLPQIDYVRIADPTGLFFRNTTSIRDRTYDVAGASVAVKHSFVTGPVHHALTMGVRGMFDTARHKLSEGSFPQAESGNLLTDDTTQIVGLSGWIADQIALSKIVLVSPAFRVEHSESRQITHRVDDDTRAPHDVHIVGSSRSTGLMPGLGLIIGTPTFNAFSSFYLGYSAPRVSQSITPDGKDTELHAEHSSNYEAGIRARIGKWLRVEGDGFWINFDNQLVSNNPLSGQNSEFVDGGRTRHLGAETTLTARLGKALHWPLDVDVAGNYTFVQARFVGGTFAGKTVPYSPQSTTTATLDVHHQAGFGGEASFSYTGAQYSDEQNTTEQGPTGLDGRLAPFTSLNFALRYRNPVSGLGVSATMKNALNQIYISDRLPNGIFTSGFRQFFMAFSWTSPD